MTVDTTLSIPYRGAVHQSVSEKGWAFVQTKIFQFCSEIYQIHKLNIKGNRKKIQANPVQKILSSRDSAKSCPGNPGIENP